MPRPLAPTLDVGHQAGGEHRPTPETDYPTTQPSVTCPACGRAGRGEYPAVARRPRTKQRRSFPRGLTPSNRAPPYFAYLASIRRSARLRAKKPGPSWVPSIDGYFVVGVDPRR